VNGFQCAFDAIIWLSIRIWFSPGSRLASVGFIFAAASRLYLHTGFGSYERPICRFSHADNSQKVFQPVGCGERVPRTICFPQNISALMTRSVIIFEIRSSRSSSLPLFHLLGCGLPGQRLQSNTIQASMQRLPLLSQHRYPQPPDRPPVSSQGVCCPSFSGGSIKQAQN